MSVTFRVLLRGQPLRRTYVSHTDFSRVPIILFFRTDEAGRVTVSNAGTFVPFGSTEGPDGTITVRIHAQNAVVRVLDGNVPVPLEVSQEFSVSNAGTINIVGNNRQEDHFRIMASCQATYDRVWRQFRPFNRPQRDAFPFGQGDSVLDTRDQLPRIEVVYPDNSPSTLAFVEPVSIGTGYPLIHLKHKAFNPPGPPRVDRRLFGIPDPVPDPEFPIPSGADPVLPSLIPHELSHALYFSLMPAPMRSSVEAQYLAWIIERLAADQPPFHNVNLVTTRFIAWIESLGLFGERLFFFSLRNPQLTGSALRRAFFRDELSATPSLQGINLSGYQQVGELVSGSVQPRFTGNEVEGAVYGALFLDLARRLGLREAAGLYLDSVEDSVLNFDDFHNLLIRQTDFDDDIVEVRNTWL
jgi:hypothetical protein